MWRILDLRHKESTPAPDALVALYLKPTTVRGQWYREEHYEIGRFKAPDGGRKLWWQDCRGTQDLVRMKRHYEIWWRYIQECPA